MKKANHPHHPDITDEMWKNIDIIIEEGRGKPGSLIAVLRKCQEQVGYLPSTLLDFIGKGLNISTSEVFGVATFYSFFSLTPKGRNRVKVCTGTACYVKGIKDALVRIKDKYGVTKGETTDDRRFSLEEVRCLGACGLAPVMVVNNDVHGGVGSDKVIDILEKYE